MRDFLSNLLARSFADATAIQPRVPSLFESAADELFDDSHLSMPATGAREAFASANVPPPTPRISPARETATGKSITNVSDERAEEHPHKPGAPAPENGPLITQAPRSGEQMAHVRKLEPKTDKAIIPVNSFRDEEKDADNKKCVPQVLSKPRPIQRRHRKDSSPVEERSSGPIIRVTIGRIEVRAVHPPAPTPKPAKPAPTKLSLDEYLRGGKR
jgi:hypothetical protein